jgi:glutaminyl-tRNA synthetase
MNDIAEPAPLDFVRAIISTDVAKTWQAEAGAQPIDAQTKPNTGVVTRFPPEPNGYLHIGHAKSVCLNFGVAREFDGRCHLRFDDTNPTKESLEFVEAIKEDVHWLGFDWGEHLKHASDYFDALYTYAHALIDAGKAYVCSLSAEEIREYRGTLTSPGRPSPFRERSGQENRELFTQMRAGAFADGAHVLRAKIDMSSSNLNLRDPVIYRIRHAEHQATGNDWPIYPMYDYTHCVCDALEGITHSLCTLEFEDHRPLYDWFLDQLDVPCHPRQIEFSRLNVEYTVTSKRTLNGLIQSGQVVGWDDPRMPTVRGMRRRGYPAAAIREFCARVGVTKKENTVEVGALEACVRESLDATAPRLMCVQRPIKVVIDNYPEGETEQLDAKNHPGDESFGVRQVGFSRELYIEQDDFMIDPPRKYFRLSPGREVRLRYAYIVKCESFETDDDGNVVLVHCTYDPASRGGNAADGRKIKGTIHWVSAHHGVRAEVRLYDRLFAEPSPKGSAEEVAAMMNPESLEVLPDSVVEAAAAGIRPGGQAQFERLGYYCADEHEHSSEAPVFNRTVTLRDTWAKVAKRG